MGREKQNTSALAERSANVLFALYLKKFHPLRRVEPDPFQAVGRHAAETAEGVPGNGPALGRREASPECLFQVGQGETPMFSIQMKKTSPEGLSGGQAKAAREKGKESAQQRKKAKIYRIDQFYILCRH
jgi:hypothetical protein